MEVQKPIEKPKRELSPESKIRKVRNTLNNLAEKMMFGRKASK